MTKKSLKIEIFFEDLPPSIETLINSIRIALKNNLACRYDIKRINIEEIKDGEDGEKSN